ncbi:MAG TPA: lysophospholipid acyltransferase family protein [Acidobacteriota bacterium]|nr:lysophospholipid acyltransferase family protein [Acidobacteriota bacterium]
MTWSKQAGEWLYYFGFLPLIAPLPRGLRQSLGRRQALRNLRRQNDSRFHTIANLRSFLGLPEDQARQVAEESYVMKLADELDAYGYPRLSPKLVASRFQVEGREHLDTLQSQGRGAVLATVHLGSICMAVMAMGQLGWSVYPFTHDSRHDASMGRALNGYSRWRLFWIERRCGGRAIYVDLKASSASKGLGSLEALQVLRQGGFVSMPLDIPPQLVDSPLEADFLDRRCRFPSGPARLAALAKVPIVPYFILRDESDWSRFKLILRPPCEPSGNAAQDLQHCLDPAAGLIQDHPQQWTAWDSASQFLADTSAG